MLDWIQSNDTIVWWLVASSAFTFLASLILVPMLVVRIPADYFTHRKRHHKRPEKYPPVIRIIVLIIKNVLGLILFCAGILMLVLPGQGLFTMFIGIMMMNFPGKYRVERWIVERGPVLKSINWLRARAGHPPLRTSAVDNSIATGS
jgi:archaellum biogenesis protein FlaJ (TadC family)